jgi:hypothetical protein
LTLTQIHKAFLLLTLPGKIILSVVRDHPFVGCDHRLLMRRFRMAEELCQNGEHPEEVDASFRLPQHKATSKRPWGAGTPASGRRLNNRIVEEVK